MEKTLHWKIEWDGKPNESTRVHQLIKKGVVVAYIKQEHGEKMGAEYVYIRGDFRPVFAGKSSSILSIKRALEKWALGKGKVREIRD